MRYLQFFLAILLTAIPCSAGVIYVDVDASGANNGSSWQDAYNLLQDALTEAKVGDQIWVAEGIYYPTSDYGLAIGDRGKHFRMKNGVKIYGGFSGTGAPDMADRDPNQYETVLSGDIGATDDPGDNCYHVFYHSDGLALDPNAVLDGFTITGGNADGSGDHRWGGGMFNEDSSPTVTNCTFTGNSAVVGGGMYNKSSSPIVTNCIFTSNLARSKDNGGGGGMFNFVYSSPIVNDCTFTGNSSDRYGGGMDNCSNSSPIVTNCTFTGNSAGYGGGMTNYLLSSPTVINCTFNGNSAWDGGGMSNDEWSNPKVTNCIFSGNIAARMGGGMYNKASSSPTVISCTFSGNSADAGGGMYNRTFSSPTVTNCTFTANSADYGGGMCNLSSAPIVANSILWGNNSSYGGNEIYNFSYGTPVISYCDIAGCGGSGAGWDTALGYDRGGNIDVDPLFVDSAGGDSHLQPDSPCVDTGSNWAPSLPTTDFEGEPRIMNGIVDIGADEVTGDLLFSLNVIIQPFVRAGTVILEPIGGVYLPGTEVTITADAEEGYIFDYWSGDLTVNENQAPINMDSHKYVTAHFTVNSDVIYVNADAAGANNGSSWTNAFTDLQDALVAAVSGKDIWVAQGTYYPTTKVGGWIDRYKTFQMKNGVKIYGGFGATGNPDMADRDPNMYETILSGDLLGNDKPDTPMEDLIDDPCRTDNCYHVFYHPEGLALDPNAILDGFTITAGNADGYRDGGGMYNYGSSPIVTNCTFTANSAYHGGGMSNRNSSSPKVTGCTFSGNWADWGSGMLNWESSPTVTNCTFTGNSADDGGGGMNNSDGSPTVTNCTFTSNSAGWRGGGMYNGGGSPAVTNCTFTGNSAGYGGGMGNSGSSTTVTNCTFSGNIAARMGGGMYNYDSSPTVTNCTFTGNSADGGGGMYNYLHSSPIVTNCAFTGNYSADDGGGIYNERDSAPIVVNCILWGNNASDGNEIYNNNLYNSPSTPVISYCDIAGCGASGAGWDDDLGSDGGGNIDADPLFVDPNGNDGIIGTQDDNLRLLADSPCIDAGDNSAVDPNGTDLDGNPRIMNDVVDMGAYEFLPPIEADVHIIPRVINRQNRMKRIIAIVRLPEGIDKADVSDEPFILSAQDLGDDGIEAIWQRVIGWGPRTRIFALFDKAELMDFVSRNGPVELTVTGKLESGRCIYGSDTVRIIRPTRRRPRWRRRL